MMFTKLFTRPSAISEACATILREALEEAEAGRVRACLIVRLDSDRQTAVAYETGDAFMTLVGAATVAVRDMIEDASD